MDGERKQRATAALPRMGEPRLLWHMERPREERDLPKVTQTVHAPDLSPVLIPCCHPSKPSHKDCLQRRRTLGCVAAFL